MTVREARADELTAVMNVLDGAMLQARSDAVRAGIETGAVLVAVADDRVLGALVLSGREIDAVAVRRTRRGQGLGTALVEAATERVGSPTAEFDAAVRPFYESLGFDVRPVGDGRFRGVR